jgi:hypothetical protein
MGGRRCRSTTPQSRGGSRSPKTRPAKISRPKGRSGRAEDSLQLEGETKAFGGFLGMGTEERAIP